MTAPDSWRVLAIHPLRDATRIAICTREGESARLDLPVPGAAGETLMDEVPGRTESIRAALTLLGDDAAGLAVVTGRGGLLRPVPSGTYLVNDLMLRDLREQRRGEHVANLGAFLAREVASHLGLPAFIVDPISVDELDPVARFSGVNGIDRVSLSHALIAKAACRTWARGRGQAYEDLQLLVVSMGHGVTVSAHRRGRMIDATNSVEEGPFGLERAGGVPALQLVDLALSGNLTRPMLKRRLFGEGGVVSYLGTRDPRELCARVAAGDPRATEVLRAMIYQTAKEVGAMAAVLAGAVDAVLLTGVLAAERRIVDELVPRIAFTGPVVVLPALDELRALADGTFRVLDRQEDLRTYE